MHHPLKIAIVGVGLIGPRHAQAVVADPDTELVAIVDPQPAGADIAATFGVAHYTSVASLLASSDKPDAAVICTPNHTHADIGIQLLEAGVAVLVEKPISHDIVSGRRLVDTAARTGIKLLVGHHRRFNAYTIAAKKCIDSGSLGEVVAVNGLWTSYKPADYFQGPGHWRTTEHGGVVSINLIHDVDLLQHLCGRIMRVYAEPLPTRRGHAAEEGAAITFRFESGAVGTFLLGDNVPSPHNWESGTGENPLIPKTGQDCYRIFGTEGVLSVPDMTVSSYADGNKSWTETMSVSKIAVPDTIPFQLQLQHFIRVLRGEEVPSCSGEDGFANLLVCDAVKQSLRTGMPANIVNI